MQAKGLAITNPFPRSAKLQGRKALPAVALAAAFAAGATHPDSAEAAPSVVPSLKDDGVTAVLRIRPPEGVTFNVVHSRSRCSITATPSDAVSWWLGAARKGRGRIVGKLAVNSSTSSLIARIDCDARVRTSVWKGVYVIRVTPRKPKVEAAVVDGETRTAVTEAVRSAVERINAHDGSAPSVKSVLTEGGVQVPAPPRRPAGLAGEDKAREESAVAKAGTGDASTPSAVAETPPAVEPRIPAPLTSEDARYVESDREEISIARARKLLAEGRPEEAREAARKFREAIAEVDVHGRFEVEVIEQAANLMSGRSDTASSLRKAASAKGWLPFEVVRLSLAGEIEEAGRRAPEAIAAMQTFPAEAAWRLLPFAAEAAYTSGDKVSVTEAARQMSALKVESGPEGNLDYVRGLTEIALGRREPAIGAFRTAAASPGPWREKAKVRLLVEEIAAGRVPAEEIDGHFNDLIKATRGTNAEIDALKAAAAHWRASGDVFGAVGAFERVAELSKGRADAQRAEENLQAAIDAAYAAALENPRLAGQLLKIHEAYGRTGPEDIQRRRSSDFAKVIEELGLSPREEAVPGPKTAPAQPAAEQVKPAARPQSSAATAQQGQPIPPIRPVAEGGQTKREATAEQEQADVPGDRKAKVAEAGKVPERKPPSAEHARALWVAGDMVGAAREFSELADAGETIDRVDAAVWAAAALASGDEASAVRAASVAGGAIESVLSATATSRARRPRDVVDAAVIALDSATALIDAHVGAFGQGIVEGIDESESE